jgi:hypothetical protein
VFILIFQRSVCCLSPLEPASDVGRSIYFLPPSKNLLTVRISGIAEYLSIEARRLARLLGSENLVREGEARGRS